MREADNLQIQEKIFFFQTWIEYFQFQYERPNFLNTHTRTYTEKKNRCDTHTNFSFPTLQ